MRNEQLTMKQVKAMYNNVIELGYCEAYYLLKHRNRMGYTAGVYGWNADIYGFVNTAIVTGYRPFGNIKVNREIVKDYEQRAERIYKENCGSWEDLEELLLDFINKVTEVK